MGRSEDGHPGRKRVVSTFSRQKLALGLSFHKDAKRSFYVNPARQTFRCHECGVKGSAIDFVSKYECVAGGSGTEASCPRRLEERAGPGENSLRLVF
jgi:CHC2 zinc finger